MPDYCDDWRRELVMLKRVIFLILLINFLVVLNVSAKDKSLDVSDEFLGPQNQFNTPFCQSFAMIGLLEHYWYKKTKTHMKFSEKYMVKSILLTLVERLWIEEEQRFDTSPFQEIHVGNLGISVILEAVMKYGVVPDSAYPSVIKFDDNEIFNLDMDKYNDLKDVTFEEFNESGKTLSDVKLTIEHIFNSPQSFSVAENYFSYLDFSNHTIRLTSPIQILDFIEFKSSDFQVVFNQDGFIPGREIFSMENYDYWKNHETYWDGNFAESHATEMISNIEKAIDLGIPVIFWNKWQKLINGRLSDTGGHLTSIVGYQKTPDGETWYRVKNSGGVNADRIERLIDGTTSPLIREKGYSYFEKDTLKTLLIAIIIPSIFL